MKVSIYERTGFNGSTIELEEGEYPVIPIGDDKLSSIKIAPGFYVYLYGDSGFRGKKVVLFEGDYEDLRAIDNKVSSIKVMYQQPELFPLISFFEHNDFKGFRQNLAGTGESTLFNMPFVANDNVSSVIVPEGTSVTLYEHAGFKGKSLYLKPGQHRSLGVYGFNDQVSSVEIQRPDLELVHIKFIAERELPNGSPIGISSRTTSISDVTQKTVISLQRELSKSVTRSWSNSTMVGIEVSTTTSVGVESGPVSASVSSTITARLENTFTIGEEEVKTETYLFSQSVDVTIPPYNIGTARVVLTPKKYEVDAIYTFRIKDTGKTVEQPVFISVDDFQAGEAFIETYPANQETETA